MTWMPARFEQRQATEYLSGTPVHGSGLPTFTRRSWVVAERRTLWRFATMLQVHDMTINKLYHQKHGANCTNSMDL
jgi:hypothetical protein